MLKVTRCRNWKGIIAPLFGAALPKIYLAWGVPVRLNGDAVIYGCSTPDLSQPVEFGRGAGEQRRFLGCGAAGGDALEGGPQRGVHGGAGSVSGEGHAQDGPAPSGVGYIHAWKLRPSGASGAKPSRTRWSIKSPAGRLTSEPHAAWSGWVAVMKRMPRKRPPPASIIASSTFSTGAPSARSA